MVSFASRCSLVWPQFSLLCQMLSVSPAYIEQAWWKNYLNTDVFLLSVVSCWFTSIPKTSYPTREDGTHVFFCSSISKEFVHTMLCFNQQINKLNLGWNISYDILCTYFFLIQIKSNIRNYLDLMSQLCASDVLAYDYCGYGFSEGTPTEETCYESIEAVVGKWGGKDGPIPFWELLGKEMVGGN